MAILSGLGSQIGFKAEVTPGTAVAVDRFFPLVSESLTADPERLESAGIIAGRRLMTSEQWNGGNITVGGDVGLELFQQGTGLLWSHMLGGNATTGANPYTHTATLGDLSGKSLTVQVGRPGTGGVVHPFTYAGCKVASWELACSQGEIATLGLTLIGMSEATTGAGANALQTASYTTNQGKPFKFNHASVTVAGTSVPVKSATISGDNHLSDDRRFLGSQIIAEPLEVDLREITGSLEAEFVDLTQYNRVVAGTEAALVLAFTSGANSLTITANVRFDGETPTVGGKEILAQNLNFKVVASSTDAAAITAVTINTNVAA